MCLLGKTTKVNRSIEPDAECVVCVCTFDDVDLGRSKVHRVK